MLQLRTQQSLRRNSRSLTSTHRLQKKAWPAEVRLQGKLQANRGRVTLQRRGCRSNSGLEILRRTRSFPERTSSAGSVAATLWQLETFVYRERAKMYFTVPPNGVAKLHFGAHFQAPGLPNQTAGTAHVYGLQILDANPGGRQHSQLRRCRKAAGRRAPRGLRRGRSVVSLRSWRTRPAASRRP